MPAGPPASLSLSLAPSTAFLSSPTVTPSPVTEPGRASLSFPGVGPSALLVSAELSVFFFLALLPPCSLSGRFLGLEILPVGGRRGLGKRCFCGRSSSSTSGSSPLACSFARKKFCMMPISDLRDCRVTGSCGGGASRLDEEMLAVLDGG